MSLDKNLFTLNIATRSPPYVDLYDPITSDSLYQRRKDPAPSQVPPLYEWSLYDPLSDARLATVSAPNAISKKKTITLHDPDVPVVFSFTGTVSFKWSFTWESHEFEWKKDACYMLRKPDPPVMIAVTEAEKKGKPASVQILDYNLRRFDIDDRKGLEVVLLCGFLTFVDYTEGHHDQANARSSAATSSPTYPSLSNPKIPPPDLIFNFSPREQNEVIVTDDGAVDDYAKYCAKLLAEKDLLFVIIRASSAAHVSKVVQIAEETKRRRHRDSEDDEEELYQYVRYDDADHESNTAKGKKGKVIKLDDASITHAKKEVVYRPPESLTIHLSKIPMPELAPKASPPPARHAHKRGVSQPQKPSPQIPPNLSHFKPNSSKLSKPSTAPPGGKRAPSSSPPSAPLNRPGVMDVLYPSYGYDQPPFDPLLRQRPPPPQGQRPGLYGPRLSGGSPTDGGPVPSSSSSPANPPTSASNSSGLAGSLFGKLWGKS